jgi:hypothetical protein
MEAIGLLAAACVLATFCMKSMMALRAFAIVSNVLFIVYGVGANLYPIVILHAILLPINGWSLGRLWSGWSGALVLGLVAAVTSFVLTGTAIAHVRNLAWGF